MLRRTLINNLTLALSLWAAVYIHLARAQRIRDQSPPAPQPTPVDEELITGN
ncbi:MAG: hypothetical protein L0331_26780 [Chloroflexi bacterium]|nr:hypothetical protein [Chloroflexota bacterium]MCI0644101.1 hypothetical protein [Chloroflexota bacterium]